MRVLVFNPIVGSGKTTVALNFAAALARNDEQVVLVDLDPNLGMTSRLSPFLSEAGATVIDWIEGTSRQPVTVGQLNKLLFYSGHEAGLDRINALNAAPDLGTKWHVVDAPSMAADGLEGILPDCDLVIVPTKPEKTAIDALSSVVTDLINSGMRPEALRLLVTQYSNRMLSHQKQRAQLIEAHGSTAVLPVVIRSSAKLSSAEPAEGIVFNHAIRSTGVGDFQQLTRAILSEKALFSQKGVRS